jgi:hypothetical protein
MGVMALSLGILIATTFKSWLKIAPQIQDFSPILIFYWAKARFLGLALITRLKSRGSLKNIYRLILYLSLNLIPLPNGGSPAIPGNSGEGYLSFSLIT